MDAHVSQVEHRGPFLGFHVLGFNGRVWIGVSEFCMPGICHYAFMLSNFCSLQLCSFGWLWSCIASGLMCQGKETSPWKLACLEWSAGAFLTQFSDAESCASCSSSMAWSVRDLMWEFAFPLHLCIFLDFCSCECPVIMHTSSVTSQDWQSEPQQILWTSLICLMIWEAVFITCTK